MLVSRSVELNEPMIYISANYRLNGKSRGSRVFLECCRLSAVLLVAFGFLASSEVKAEGLGNLGMRDRKNSFLLLLRLI